MSIAGKFFAALVTLTIAGLGCTPAPAEPDDEAVAHEIGLTVAETGGAVTTLATTLAPVLRAGEADEGTIRQRLRSAIRDSVVSVGCVSFSWTLTSATVLFDECELLDTGARIDGSTTISVRILNRSVTVTLDDLAIGSAELYGSMTARLMGPLGELTVGVDSEMTLANIPATLIVDGLEVDANLEGMTMWGPGAVISPNLDATTSVDQVHWNLGECWPSSGSVSFVDGNLEGTITFVPTTPETGEVQLQLHPLPPATVEMLPACP
jgi:hypothetical protein